MLITCLLRFFSTLFACGLFFTFSCNSNHNDVASSEISKERTTAVSEALSVENKVDSIGGLTLQNKVLSNNNQKGLPAQIGQNTEQPVPATENGKQPAKTGINTDGDSAQTTFAFPWLTQPVSQTDALQNRITPPSGYTRTPAARGSFAGYLRSLPLKPGVPPVLLFDGSPKYNQNAHAAVFNIDPGTEDLQQCADAVMRLRAEYLWAAGQYSGIHFNFTSGHNAQYSKWRQGYRPVIWGNNVSWQQQASEQNSASYASFRQYLKQVFTYAGTYSLNKELQSVANLQSIEPGDVFIKGGMPGHAVLVVDVAQNSDGQKVFLLAQSYMPAQEIHLLQNPNNTGLSPWYSAQFTGDLITPEWTFAPNSHKRFK